MNKTKIDINSVNMVEKDFIAQFPGLVPAEFCQMLIDRFETNREIQKSIIHSAQHNISKGLPFLREDSAYFLQYHDLHAPDVISWLWLGLEKYVQKYQQLAEVPLWPSEIKMQRTEPSGGYHHWHHENGIYEVAQRELVWMIYLNDVADGQGETEFLYQRTRIKPTVGTLVIWPAGMTHVHRGNTMFTQNKYILTGWYIKIPR